MSVLTLEYGFENKLNDINIRKFIFNIVRGRVSSPQSNFKNLLTEVEQEFQQDKQISTDIKKLSRDDLKALNKKFKKLNNYFDKLNSIYYNENYFGDGELKQLFSSISRQAHKVENLSHKYLYQDQKAAQTPDYIKEGLSKFSNETITEKLRTNN